MARRVVSGGLRATCIREYAVSPVVQSLARHIRRATRSIIDFLHSDSTSASRPLPMEPLEQRQLLTGVSLSNGVLTVSGPDGQRNTLTVTKNSAGQYVAKSNSISHT